MADFRTHVTTSTVLGVAYGTAGYLYGLPLPSSILAGGLCGVAGMLPDLDSGPGKPLRESLAFAAAVVSTMLVDRFQKFGLSLESIVLAGVAVYFAIRFGLAQLLARYTVHRGMFHSLPAALIFGEIAFLLVFGDVPVRCLKAGGVVLGYLSHLVLDEIYSVNISGVRIKVKKSFGSALKIFGPKPWPNVSAFGKLGLLTLLVFAEPGWMEGVVADRLRPAAEKVAVDVTELLDYLDVDPQSAMGDATVAQEGAGEQPGEEPPPATGFDPNRSVPETPRTTQFPEPAFR